MAILVLLIQPPSRVEADLQTKTHHAYCVLQSNQKPDMEKQESFVWVPGHNSLAFVGNTLSIYLTTMCLLIVILGHPQF